MIKKVDAATFVATRCIGLMLGVVLGSVGMVNETQWLWGVGLGMCAFSVIDFIAFWVGADQ